MTLYLSKQGMKNLKKKISKLEREEKKLEMELRNSDVKEDEIRQAEVLARMDAVRDEIWEKKSQLASAKILHREKHSVKVMIGSVVELFDRASGKVFKFQLVDSLETNPTRGKISSQSPLGKSLIGRKVDEIIEFTAGLANRQMVLVSIG
ncbi:MAG: GreA/GreB family elongation factor [bacterium]|nr:GreA/GreB family elongation factor [bacterium]